MARKGQLKGSKIYINHDLSREYRNIQRKFREIARYERGQGTEIRLMFRKIRTKGNWIKWKQRRENNSFL